MKRFLWKHCSVALLLAAGVVSHAQPFQPVVKVWDSQVYGTTTANGNTTIPQRFLGAFIDPSANVIIVLGRDPQAFGHGTIFKYSSAGSLLWTATVSVNGDPLSFFLGADGSFCLGGPAVVPDPLPGAPGHTATGAFINRYTSDGTLAWSKQIKGGIVNPAVHLSCDAQGNVWVARAIQENLVASYLALAKYGPSGNLLFSKQLPMHPTSNSQGGLDLSMLPGNNPVVLTANGVVGSLSIVATKYLASGSTDWARPLTVGRVDWLGESRLGATAFTLKPLCPSPDGSLYVGTSSGDLVHVSPTGERIWGVVSPDQNALVNDYATDAEGNLLALEPQKLVKYSAAKGIVLSSLPIQPPWLIGNALAVDVGGNSYYASDPGMNGASVDLFKLSGHGQVWKTSYPTGDEGSEAFAVFQNHTDLYEVIGRWSGQTNFSVNLVKYKQAIKAVDDAYKTPMNTNLTVSGAGGLQANDVNAEGSRCSLVAGPQHGALSLGANGSIIYKPRAGFSGSDHFTYIDKLDTLQSNEATVTVTVGAA